MEKTHIIYFMTKKSSKTLSTESLAVAARVNVAWQKRKARLGLTQEAAAGLSGMSQGDFSKYINAHLPITLEVLLRFAKLLNEKASVLGPELVGPYAKQVDAMQTEGLSYYPDDKDALIASLKQRLDMVAEGTAPYHLQSNKLDVENWDRIVSAIDKLDSPDLQYFADIIEHRLALQDGRSTGLVKDTGVVGNDAPTTKAGLAEKLR